MHFSSPVGMPCTFFRLHLNPRAIIATQQLEPARRPWSPGLDKQVLLDKLARQIPLKMVGEPNDIANAVLYLASDESRFMTGAELKLDGGISAM